MYTILDTASERRSSRFFPDSFIKHSEKYWLTFGDRARREVETEFLCAAPSCYTGLYRYLNIVLLPTRLEAFFNLLIESLGRS